MIRLCHNCKHFEHHGTIHHEQFFKCDKVRIDGNKGEVRSLRKWQIKFCPSFNPRFIPVTERSE